MSPVQFTPYGHRNAVLIQTIVVKGYATAAAVVRCKIALFCFGFQLNAGQCLQASHLVEASNFTRMVVCTQPNKGRRQASLHYLSLHLTLNCSINSTGLNVQVETTQCSVCCLAVCAAESLD